MSRLIDGDELLSYIDRVKNSGLGKQKTIEYITKYISNMPTAYDFDKVVSELEDYKMWKELLIYDLDFRERQIIKRALEIVWRGGIDVEKAYKMHRPLC